MFIMCSVCYMYVHITYTCMSHYMPLVHCGVYMHVTGMESVIHVHACHRHGIGHDAATVMHVT